MRAAAWKLKYGCPRNNFEPGPTEKRKSLPPPTARSPGDEACCGGAPGARHHIDGVGRCGFSDVVADRLVTLDAEIARLTHLRQGLSNSRQGGCALGSQERGDVVGGVSDDGR